MTNPTFEIDLTEKNLFLAVVKHGEEASTNFSTQTYVADNPKPHIRQRAETTVYGDSAKDMLRALHQAVKTAADRYGFELEPEAVAQ